MNWNLNTKAGTVGLLAFLVAATLFIGLFNPAFAIFPFFMLFLVGVSLFFRPWRRSRSKRREVSFRSPESRSDAGIPRPLRRDEDIAADVMARLSADPALGMYGIEAHCRSGRVKLHGKVKEMTERERARALAAAVPGVLDVSADLRLYPATRGRTA